MRKGYIKISNHIYVKEWPSIWVFFKDFRPLHIEFRHWENNTWHIYGVSEMFEEIKEGEAIPEYLVIFTNNKNKELSYEFQKIPNQ